MKHGTWGLKIGNRFLIMICRKDECFPCWTPRRGDADGFDRLTVESLSLTYGAELFKISEDKKP